MTTIVANAARLGSRIPPTSREVRAQVKENHGPDYASAGKQDRPRRRGRTLRGWRLPTTRVLHAPFKEIEVGQTRRPLNAGALLRRGACVVYSLLADDWALRVERLVPG